MGHQGNGVFKEVINKVVADPSSTTTLYWWWKYQFTPKNKRGISWKINHQSTKHNYLNAHLWLCHKRPADGVQQDALFRPTPKSMNLLDIHFILQRCGNICVRELPLSRSMYAHHFTSSKVWRKVLMNGSPRFTACCAAVKASRRLPCSAKTWARLLKAIPSSGWSRAATFKFAEIRASLCPWRRWKDRVRRSRPLVLTSGAFWNTQKNAPGCRIFHRQVNQYRTLSEPLFSLWLGFNLQIPAVWVYVFATSWRHPAGWTSIRHQHSGGLMVCLSEGGGNGSGDKPQQMDRQTHSESLKTQD